MKIALLIDADNTSYQHIDRIFDNLKEFGEVKIAKAFGRNNNLKSWEGNAGNYKLSIERHQKEGKNSADFSMTIAGVEILTQYHHLDAFCIVSGDADFVYLIAAIKDKQKYVIGMGGKNTAQRLKEQCDKFFDLSQSSLKSSKSQHKNTKKKLNENTNLTNLIKKIIKEQSEDEQFVKLQIVGSILGNQPNRLKSKDYGYKSWKELFLDLNFITMYVNGNNQVLVKIKEKNSSKKKTNKKLTQSSSLENFEEEDCYYNPKQQAYYQLSEWSQFMSDITGIQQDWDWYND